MHVKSFGVALMVGGVLLLLVGVAGYLGAGSSDGAAGESSGTPTTVTTTVPVTTSTVATTTVPASTSTVATTTAPATTSTVEVEAAETVEEFVFLFATALEDGDLDFVWQRLHPEIVAKGGEDVCRAWVENEIMALSDYTLHEVTAGPQTIDGIPDVYSAAVSFTYQGQVFDDASGQYALVDGTFRWLGACR